VVQPLPPAIFADVYELDNAAAVGLGPLVKLFGPVDVESIEKYSQPTALVVYAGNLSSAEQARFLYGQLGAALLSTVARCHCPGVCMLAFGPLPAALPRCLHRRSPLQAPPAVEATLAVPLHARYPLPRHPTQPSQAAQTGWTAALRSADAAMEVPQPRVLVRCPPGSGAASDSLALWQEATVERAGAAAQELMTWDMPAGNLQHGPFVAAGTAAALLGSAAAVLWALYRPQQALSKQR
jgi:hypothetical protein